MTTIKTTANIQLAILEEKHKEVLAAFQLPKEQLQFTSLPLEKLNNPQVEKTACHVVILLDHEPIGYFVLEEGEKLQRYSSNPHAKLLTSFSLDSKHQGKGYAKHALQLLPQFVKMNFSNIDEVVLGVNKRNQGAIGLYRRMGFQDNGEEYLGTKGPQHIFYLKLT
ncbi:GNAT family N-acetyltransferase [Jeotgalibacillus malaysiensis]|uniref:GNAT family N-acetyltransferase n=1 Tax=Jeotgalibacillus malaysiensis TaxID=1508404 RepID=UPI00384F2CBD